LTGALRLLLDDAVASGVGSGAEALVLAHGRTAAHVVVGQAASTPAPRPHAVPAWWDLASLTKPLVGAAVTYALVERGQLALETEAHTVWDTVPVGVTIAHLLSHSAGYRPWAPLFESVSDWGSEPTRSAILERAAGDALVARPGTRYAYSDLGFLALCGVIERVGGARLDRLWQRLIRDPAEVSGLRFGHPEAASTRVTALRGPHQGVVDDDNCAAMGGVSSHAGLFGTAAGVGALTQAFLEGFHGRGPFAWPVVRTAWTTRGSGSHWLGWDGRSRGASSSGAYFPDDSVGHLGFTGTSIWVAPSWHVVVVLLTNRVHPSDAEARHKPLRRAVHDAVAAHLGRPSAPR